MRQSTAARVLLTATLFITFRTQIATAQSSAMSQNSVVAGASSLARNAAEERVKQSLNVNLPAGRYDRTCNLGTTDRYERPMRLGENSTLYLTQCLDTSRFRAAEFVSEDKVKKTITFANFYHEGRWWKATLPTAPEKWESVYFQILRFPVGGGVEAAHTELRFKLKKGSVISLQSQTGGEVQEVTSFVYSAEAGFPVGVTYNFALGAYNNYPLVGRILSSEQKLKETAHTIEQYELKLDAVSRAEFAVAALRRSEATGLLKFYNTIRPNCTSEAFDIIDSLAALRAKNPRPFYTVLWIDPIAGPSLRALQARQILGPRIENMEVEFGVRAAAPPLPLAKGPIRRLISVQDGYAIEKPFALVTIMEDSVAARKITEKTIRGAEEILGRTAPQMATTLIAPVIMGGGFNSALGGVLVGIRAELEAYLNRVNKDLPDTPVYLLAYLAPWRADAKPASLVSTGIQADLPFNYDRYLRTTADGKPVKRDDAEKLTRAIYQNMRELQNREYKIRGTTPAFLMGVVIRLKLQRNQPTVDLQLAASLVPQTLPFKTYSDRVDLNRVNLPGAFRADRVGEDRAAKPSLLISYLYKHFQNPAAYAQVDLGVIGPIDMYSPRDYGTVRVAQDELSCQRSARLVPELQGTFKQNMFGANTWQSAVANKTLAGKFVGIGIYGLKLVFNAEEFMKSLPYGKAHDQAVEAYSKSKTGVIAFDMKVRTDLLDFGILKCLPIGFVSSTIQEEASASIDATVGSAIDEANKSLMDVMTSKVSPFSDELRSAIENANRIRKQIAQEGK